MYGGERADARILDELEAVLRAVSEELVLWRARAQKAESDPREGARPGPARPDPEVRNRLADLEAENKTLRVRVEAARARVHELLGRLTFLEEQAREAGNGRGSPR
jgi:cell division protein FtsB